MDSAFMTSPGNLFPFAPESMNYPLNKNENLQALDIDSLTGYDSGIYSVPNGDLLNNTQSLFPYQDVFNDTITDSQNMVNENVLNQNMMNVNGHNLENVTDFNSTYQLSNGFDNYYAKNSYLAPEQYFNCENYGKVDQFYNQEQQFNSHNFSETKLVEPTIAIGDSNLVQQTNSPNFYNQPVDNLSETTYHNNFCDSGLGFQQTGNFQQFQYFSPAQGYQFQTVNGTSPQNVQSNMEWNNVPLVDLNTLHNQLNSGAKNTLNDDLESIANASTVESTPVLHPSPSPSNSQFQLSTLPNLPNVEVSNNLTNMNNGFMNGFQDLSDTQLVNPGNYFFPNYYQGYYNQPVSAFSAMNDSENGYFANDDVNESIIEIANEIANNVQYLPDKDSNGKYSLDKNHPIHCVWRDVNRGHCSWRCRWWENGKRLSKNFNVKRFGDFEAMRMAITMKIRNSTPVERIQLLKEQREAVRNQFQLFNNFPQNYSYNLMANNTANFSERKINKVMNDSKKLQRENWNRLSWTYLKTNKLESSTNSTIICRLCSKTTRCSRSRNLQQAHIMHLIRMHKNPWKQYIDPNGLTKMCKLALDALYEQKQFSPNHHWNLRPGIIRPDPYFL